MALSPTTHNGGRFPTGGTHHSRETETLVSYNGLQVVTSRVYGQVLSEGQGSGLHQGNQWLTSSFMG